MGCIDFLCHPFTLIFRRMHLPKLFQGIPCFATKLHNHVELHAPPLLPGLPCPLISHMLIIGPIVLRPTTTLHILTICQHLPYCHVGCLVQPPLVPLSLHALINPSDMVGLAEIAQTTSMLYFPYPNSLGWGSPYTRVAKWTIFFQNKFLYAIVGIP